MTKRNVEAYAAAQQPLCVQNDTIPESLFQEYGVNRGLRDANGVGVLTGLTNISKIVSFQNVGGKRMPCEGQLWYRGYNIKDLIGGLGPQEFGFEKIAYLLVFGQMPTPEELAAVTVPVSSAEPYSRPSSSLRMLKQGLSLAIFSSLVSRRGNSSVSKTMGGFFRPWGTSTGPKRPGSGGSTPARR